MAKKLVKPAKMLHHFWTHCNETCDYVKIYNSFWSIIFDNKSYLSALMTPNQVQNQLFILVSKGTQEREHHNKNKISMILKMFHFFILTFMLCTKLKDHDGIITKIPIVSKHVFINNCQRQSFQKHTKGSLTIFPYFQQKELKHQNFYSAHLMKLSEWEQRICWPISVSWDWYSLQLEEET